MISELDVLTMYSDFYQKVCGSPAEIDNDRSASMASKFVSISGISSVSDLYSYMSFQFRYWSRLDTKFGSKIMLNWVIGSKAISRYSGSSAIELAKDREYIRDTYGIMPDAYVSSSVPRSFRSVSVEDADRRRYLNDAIGMLFCLDYTSGYDKESLVCPDCVRAVECSDISKTINSGKVC